LIGLLFCFHSFVLMSQIRHSCLVCRISLGKCEENKY